jgi:cytochrome c biogenesis protein ResB
MNYAAEGKERGVANEIVMGEEDFKWWKKRMVYVNHSLKYKGFEFYRDEKDGYSPLFVLRDKQGKVSGGSYAPLQSIKQQDGTYFYRSGSATALDGFYFPQYPDRPPVLKIQTVYYPDKTKKMTGEVSFQVWGLKSGSQESSPESSEMLFNGKAAFGERVKAGDYFLSMDEVRYWTSMNVIHRPGLPLIFGSFWVGLGGLVLNIVLKTIYPVRENGVF